MTTPISLDFLLQELWNRLGSGVTDRRHAFHHPCLTTLHADQPAARTVILREASSDLRHLSCHLDIRSIKAGHVAHNPKVAWMFYDPQGKLQIRAEGTARIHHHDEVAEFSWHRTPPMSRRVYLTVLPPGTPMDQPGTGLPESYIDCSPSEAESERGWDNFGVLVSTITRLEWLHLDTKGHQRAGWDWTDSRWRGTWLVP
jgi:hypothetical protein